MITQKELSSQAQVAKLCRQYCKSIGVKCSAKSDGFSMGDSVNVTVDNQPPEIMEQLKTEFDQYQLGHFDGMNDIYEYSNSRGDIPQTKYLFINNHFDDDLRQRAWEYIRANYGICDGYDPIYKNVNSYDVVFENSPVHINEFMFRILNGSENSDFWDIYKSETQKTATVHDISEHIIQETGINIEIRPGTKPGYSEIVFNSKPDEETRNSLKAAGFRWSRHNGVWWGKSDNLPPNSFKESGTGVNACLLIIDKG